jgi:hypothetical protein
MILKTELIDNELLMNQAGDLWSATIGLPADQKPGSYPVNFFITDSTGKQYKKTYSVTILAIGQQTQPLTAKKTESNSALLANTDILIKTSKRTILQGETIDLYIGVLQNQDKLAVVKVVFSDNISLTAKKTDVMLWKVTRSFPANFATGKQAVKVYIKDIKGGTIEKIHYFNVESGFPAASKPVVQQQAPKSSSSWADVKVYAKVKTLTAGQKKLVIRVKGAENLAKVTTVLDGKKLTHTKDVEGFWSVGYVLPKGLTGKTVEYKVYPKDTAGNYTTIKKSLKL